MGNVVTQPQNDLQELRKKAAVSYSISHFMENDASTHFCQYENGIINCSGEMNEKLYDTIKSYYNQDPDIQIEKFKVAYFHNQQCVNRVVVTNDIGERQKPICIHLQETH